MNTETDRSFDEEFDRITDASFTAPENDSFSEPVEEIVETPAEEPVVETQPDQIFQEKLDQEVATWKGRVQKEQERARELAAEVERLRAATQAETQKPAAQSNPKILQEFQDDFPDIFAAVTLLIERAEERIVQRLESAVATQVEPVLKSAEETARQKHYADIANKHADIAEILSSGALEDWINKKSARLQATYTDIYNSGSAVDVIDMLDQFKLETGYGKAPAPEPQPATRGTPDALAAVRSRPTATPRTPTQESDQDYDAVFERITRV